MEWIIKLRVKDIDNEKYPVYFLNTEYDPNCPPLQYYCYEKEKAEKFQSLKEARKKIEELVKVEAFTEIEVLKDLGEKNISRFELMDID